MKRFFRTLVISQLLLVISGVTVAQNLKIERGEFLRYLETSYKLTKNISFRNSTTIQVTDQAEGSWEPYSSWIIEAVFPDRSYLSYKSGRQGDFLRIGKVLYSKEQNTAPWIKSEDDGSKWTSIPSNPSGAPSFQGPLVDYVVNKNELETVIHVVSKPAVEASARETHTYVYYFDRKGVLFRYELLGFNSLRFYRRTKNFEYDPSIRIEAPIP